MPGVAHQLLNFTHSGGCVSILVCVMKDTRWKIVDLLAIMAKIQIFKMICIYGPDRLSRVRNVYNVSGLSVLLCAPLAAYLVEYGRPIWGSILAVAQLVATSLGNTKDCN